ncbi:retroviral-like aspartic protease 1 [Rhizophagus irregularis DAOM 181602=DAOM 197198]|nr:retroviral-like aspartic protease 1 [Rhizophagus irregularis DAOM 181602=DAOM 197198]
MRSEVIIKGKLVSIIIDSGASVSLISDKLRKELNIPIIEKSDIRFIMANGIRVASKGKIEITIEMNENTEMKIIMDVIESVEKELILGNDVLREKKGIIDYNEKTLILREDGKDIEIPIEYENNDENINDDNDSDDSENEDSENEYEETSFGHNSGETLKMHKDWTDEIKYKDLEKLQEKELKDLVKEYEDICIYGDKKISKTNIVKCNIRLKDETPINQKAYRESTENREIIKREIDKMLKEEIIQESCSPWSSPVVIVNKKTGDKRFCIDFRKINQMTITDAYPLPRIDDLLEKFRVAKWFTTIDLASGYWQIEMEEEDKEKTAFICSQGLYEFNVMPFGLKNAPAIFQRTMNKIFKEYLDKFMNVYIDDIIIYSKNWNEHLQHIKIVLEELRKTNMMLKLKKCEWAKKNVEYLGHIVGTDGLKPDNKKIEKIKNLKLPKNIKQIREINGLCSYYRKFVKGYLKIVKPIMELTRKNVPFVWTDKQQKALEELKKKLINYPILQHLNFEKEFILITDASGEGLGAILEQLDENNREIVISYASRSLVNAEKRYPITELECLAVFWEIKYFHKYLFGRKFKVITDHAALKGFISTSKVPKGRRGRWMMELQQYDFEIIHRLGKENKNADAMSRLI